ncbi:hypothetical protein [Brevibacillus laterosporus]|uniref:hypothetical protein n=1 Tax=Brevibacillus laterosporus TaxID=1465 RepID=UPI0018CEA5D3|nr:hypothetical protein [Brevibacillus laterosporus]
MKERAIWPNQFGWTILDINRSKINHDSKVSISGGFVYIKEVFVDRENIRKQQHWNMEDHFRCLVLANIKYW